LNFSAGMASTDATVFFCRPGRTSLRAVLTGFFICAGVGWAAAAASSSKAEITIVLFILSSFFVELVRQTNVSERDHHCE
jgi:hypothetical protein